MKSVETEFRINRIMGKYARELAVWTAQTNYQFYPLSYSLRDCLELICEKLCWEYSHYEIFSSTKGHLHAMKPEPKKLNTMGWWNGTNFIETSATNWSSNLNFYTVDG